MSIGQHFGKVRVNTASQNTCRSYTKGNLERSSNRQVEAENATSRTACAVLQFFMRKWRVKIGDVSFALSDGLPHFID